MKKFIAGLLIGAILATCGATFAAPALTYVKSVFNTTVNGKVVKQDVVTINGTYYADLKQLAGSLGVKYSVDTKAKKIQIGETILTNKYSMQNPTPIGTEQAVTFKSFSDSYTANVTVKEIIRGDKAYELIKAANMFNSEAGEGYEYILAKIDFKLTNAPGGKKYDLAGYSFDLVSDKGKTYDKVLIVSPEPKLDAELYKGASNEGYVAFKVGVNDKMPKMTFGRNYDGTGGIWFKVY